MRKIRSCFKKVVSKSSEDSAVNWLGYAKIRILCGTFKMLPMWKCCQYQCCQLPRNENLMRNFFTLQTAVDFNAELQRKSEVLRGNGKNKNFSDGVNLHQLGGACMV